MTEKPWKKKYKRGRSGVREREQIGSYFSKSFLHQKSKRNYCEILIAY